MGGTGFEPATVTTIPAKDLRQSPSEGGAKSGALDAESVPAGADARAIVEALKGLSPEVRESVRKMLREGEK